jgi:sugar lactone lactonase YvrE
MMTHQSWLRAIRLKTGMLRRCPPIFLLLALAACGESSVTGPGSTPEHTPAAVCLSSAAPGTVRVFAPQVGHSEGIAFLNGKLYIAGGDGIRVLAADGSASMLATVPGTVGMVAWNGALYAASGTDGTTPDVFCSATNQGVIWKITTDGQSSVFARGFISPNFIVVTPWNTLLVADDCRKNTDIYEVDASGNTSVWNSTFASANGMVFDATFSNLFVATTFVTGSPLYEIAVTADHTAGTATKIRNYASGTTPDGVAMDQAGNLYVALNVAGLIHRVAPDGTDSPFAEGMTTPASLAFGNAPGFDPCSMYVTSLFGEDVYQVAVGTPGLPLVQ